jgi:hypothetical protein
MSAQKQFVRSLLDKSMQIRFLVLLISLHTTIYGQSFFLEKGVSGIGFASDYSVFEGVMSWGGEFSCAIKGYGDVGMMVQQSRYKDGEFYNGQVNLFGPAVQVVPLKENDGLPFTVFLEGMYAFGNFKGNLFPYYKGSGYGAGLGINKKITSDGKISISLAYSLSALMTTRRELESIYGNGGQQYVRTDTLYIDNTALTNGVSISFPWMVDIGKSTFLMFQLSVLAAGGNGQAAKKGLSFSAGIGFKAKKT